MTDRRSFLKAAALLAAPLVLPASLAQAQPAPGKRLSLTTFLSDINRVRALIQGVSVMRGRLPSDPKSWFYQAAIHGVTDEAVADALARDPAVAQVNRDRFWDQCPHFNQTSANFIIWHRAYLYYFERILREASGDPTLTLPYWDYQAADGRQFPFPFQLAFLDEAETFPNPLFDAQREAAFMGGLYTLSDGAVDASAAMDTPTFFGATEEEGFAGADLDDLATTIGLIEARPHGLIHTAVGGSIGNTQGAMSIIQTAAFDPVFWVHHANIDRLWTHWSVSEGKSWGPGPGAAWFNARPWAFNDVDGVVKEESRGHWVDHRAVGIGYESVPDDAVPLLLEPSPTVSTPFSLPTIRALKRIEGQPLSTTEPTTAALGTTLSFSATAAAPRITLVEIGGIVVDSTPNVGFHVDLVGGDTRIRLGTLNLFAHAPSGEHAHGATGMTQRFIVPASSRSLLLNNELRAEFEPFDLYQPVAGPAPERKGEVRYSQLTLLEG